MDSDICKLILKATLSEKKMICWNMYLKLFAYVNLMSFKISLLFVIDNWMFVFLGEIWKYNI